MFNNKIELVNNLNKMINNTIFLIFATEIFVTTVTSSGKILKTVIIIIICLSI